MAKGPRELTISSWSGGFYFTAAKVALSTKEMANELLKYGDLIHAASIIILWRNQKRNFWLISAKNLGLTIYYRDSFAGMIKLESNSDIMVIRDTEENSQMHACLHAYVPVLSVGIPLPQGMQGAKQLQACKFIEGHACKFMTLPAGTRNEIFVGIIL